MEIKLGTLSFLSAATHKDLLANSTAQTLLALPQQGAVGVVEIDPSFSDTAQFCQKYKNEAGIVANCVILEAKRAEKVWYAACVILSNTRADVNGLARRTLDARKVSFAPMELAVEKTRMEYGGICPIGLPNDWPILIDKAVADLDYVIIGSGIRKSKIAVPGEILASLPNAQILVGLGQSK
ncbi:MAG: YbaK/EbsC family protein [Candidatus Paceibacterota bacterium]|jgi:prolyl-tRNA editing enzyme YbaK/EbsC (Cys-tRNA(Pro) deacylase)